MSTQIVISKTSQFAAYNVPDGLLASANFTASGSNQVTAFSGLPGGPLLATVTTDENIFVVVGESPDATTTPRWMMTGPSTREFFLAPGWQVALISR